MGGPILATTKISTLQCYKCGISFGVPEPFERERRKDHESFCCPVGHWQCFTGKSEVEVLRDTLREVRVSKMELEEKLGDARRKLSRVDAGRCPYCGKRYKHLEKHMAGHRKGKHD